MKNTIRLILLLFVIFFQKIYAYDSYFLDQYKLEKVKEDKGFFQNSVRKIIQDKIGYIWIATPNGLYRYDGYEYEIYKSDIYNSKSISYNSIQDMSLTKDNNLVVLFRNKFNLYDSEKEEFISFSSKFFKDLEINNVFADKKISNRIWFTTHYNIGYFEYGNNKKIKQLKYPIFNKNFVSGIYHGYQTKSNILLFISNHSLYQCDLSNKKVVVKNKYIEHFNSINFIENIDDKDSLVYAVVSDNKKHNVIFTTSDFRDKSKMFNLTNNVVHNTDYSIKSVSFFGKDLLACYLSNDKVLFYNTKSHECYFSKYKFFHKKACVSILSTIVDDNNILWIGTARDGLYKVYKNSIYNIPDKLHLNLFSDLFINQITCHKNRIWFGSFDGGINSFKLNNRNIINDIDYNKKLDIKEHVQVSACYFDSKNRLWYAFKHKIFYAKMDNNGNVLYKKQIHTSVDFSNINFFVEDKNESIWIAASGKNNIMYVDEKDDNLIAYPLLDKKNKSKIVSLYFDKKNRMWVGTERMKIFRYILSDENKILSRKEISKNNVLSDYQVFSFYQDKKDNFWIPTFGGGLVKYDLLNDSIEKIYTINDGLSDNVVYSILEDDSGDLWMSTDNGISKLNIKNSKFSIYGANEGINNTNFRKWSFSKDEHGNMFFGGTDGITLFNPNEIITDSTKIIPYITNMLLFNKKVLYRNNIYYSSDSQLKKDTIPQLVFSASENSFEFEFSTMNTRTPMEDVYEYKLFGFDKDWIKTTYKRRFAAYSVLPKGKYIFQVRSYNSKNSSEEIYTAIKFKILPHWYNTTLAYFIYFLLGLSMVLLWRRIILRRRTLLLKIKSEQIEKENLEKINKMKLLFFTNISHEIKTPLTLIYGIVEQIKMNNKLDKNQDLYGDFTTIYNNTRRMLTLVSQLLDFRKAETGNLPMHFVKIDIVDFMRKISNYFDIFAKDKGGNFSFNSSFDKMEMVFDPDKIEKILSNLILNGFKYSGKNPMIELKVSRPSNEDLLHIDEKNLNIFDYVLFSVRDNGEGIDESDKKNIFKEFYQKTDKDYTKNKKGVGIGLAYTKKLVQLHHGSIFVKSKMGEGSTFFVLLPINQNDDVKLESIDNSELEHVIQVNRDEFLVGTEEKILSRSVNNKSIVFYDKEVLIVEDNEDIRGFLSEFLESNFKVYEAENGKEGIEVALQKVPDLIISDVMMPLVDGYELCKTLKEDTRTNHIPIILLTANANIEQRIEGINAGADSYISKPFKLEHLESRVYQLLQIRHILKEKYLSLSSGKKYEKVDINAKDKEFLKSLDEALERHLSDSSYNVQSLEEEFSFSKIQMYRKIKSITDLSCVEYIRNYRLRRAVDMMHNSADRVSEIAYSVGFSSSAYFGKCFKSYYGKTPGEMAEEIRKS